MPSDDPDRLEIDAVVFDLGGVLIDWNPRYLYRSLFGEDADAMETFLRDVWSPAWVEMTDAGMPMAEAVGRLAETYPDHRALIEAYHARWPEMLGGAIGESVRLLEELHDADVRLYALSNWSTDTFPTARDRFDFLALFDGIVISGEARITKPDPAIFHALLERFGLVADRCIFIDDSAENVEVASRLGFDTIRFRSAPELRRHLQERGLPAHFG